MQIVCDSIEVCGEIIQDLAQFLSVGEINTQGAFPAEMEHFKEVLRRVEECKSMKVQLNADVAEAINNVKQLVSRVYMRIPPARWCAQKRPGWWATSPT